jgi:DNA-binding CsgD family transcriptional regulator/extradiol dioxygenase family protein
MARMAVARPTVRRSRGRPPHDDVLTPAEWRIAHAVKHGMTNRAIAERRGISVDAVKFHIANIVAKLGVSNRKELRQWFRAPKASALSRRPTDVHAPVTFGKIGQIARTVKDIEQARHWYGQVLGLPHLYTFDRLAFFDCGGTRLMLTQKDEVSSSESILYWRVENIVDAYDGLKSRGVEFVAAPHMIHRHADGTEEWMAFFKDPEGRPLALMSQFKSESARPESARQ